MAPQDRRQTATPIIERAAPLVSVIIPVRNNRDGVARVLACLAAQTLPRDQFEVVIGDDGSEADQVPRVATSDGRVRVVEGPPCTSYAARNAAAAIARGSVLAFCDSDCLPQSDWLEEGLATLADADIVAGEVAFAPPVRPNIWSLLTIDMFLDQERNVALSRGVTANLLMKRPLMNALHGFDESLPSGGDYEFVQRAVKLGARLRYASRAIVYHPTLNRAAPFLRKVWKTNRCDGTRRARRRAQIDRLGVLLLVPILGPMLARRQAFRPMLGLHRPRLRAAAAKAGWRDDLLAVLLLYFIICYVAGSGRAVGWLEGLTGRRIGFSKSPEYRPTGPTTWS